MDRNYFNFGLKFIFVLKSKDFSKFDKKKQVGCLNFCSYCKTKYSRGNLGSFPMEAILSRVRTVLSEGVKEIRITSEGFFIHFYSNFQHKQSQNSSSSKDVGAWGIDLGSHIGVLVKEIVKVVKEYNKQHEVFLEEEILGTKSLEALKGKKYPYADSLGKVMVRLGMTNPPYMLKHIQDICEVLNEDCVFEFLHIPVQSGADPVLFEMNRQYTRKEFELMVCFSSFFVEKDVKNLKKNPFNSVIL